MDLRINALFATDGIIFKAPPLNEEQTKQKELLIRFFTELTKTDLQENYNFNKVVRKVDLDVNSTIRKTDQLIKLDLTYYVSQDKAKLELVNIISYGIEGAEELDFQHAIVADQAVLNALPVIFGKYPDLKSIKLSDTSLRSSTIKDILVGYPQLLKLDIGKDYGLSMREEIYPVILSWIQNNPVLYSIGYIPASSITEINQIARALGSACQEVGFSVQDEKILLAGLATLSAIRGANITSLRLDCPNLTSATFSLLPKQFPSLERLSISQEADMDSNVAAEIYSDFQKMDILDLPFPDLLDADLLTIVKKFPSVSKINLKLCKKLSLQGLIAVVNVLNKQSNLKELILPDNMQFSYNTGNVDPLLNALNKIIPNLKVFRLNWNTINTVNLQYIVSLLGSNLTEFSVVLTTNAPLYTQGNFLSAINSVKMSCPNLKRIILNGAFRLSHDQSGNLHSQFVMQPARKGPLFQKVKFVDFSNNKLDSQSKGGLNGCLTDILRSAPNLRFIDGTNTYSTSSVDQFKIIDPRIGKTIFFQT